MMTPETPPPSPVPEYADFCPECGSPYATPPTILGGKPDGCLEHLFCKKCFTFYLFTHEKEFGGPERYRLLRTELTPNEVGEFMNTWPIALDEVIDIHEIMETDGWIEGFHAAYVENQAKAAKEQKKAKKIKNKPKKKTKKAI